MKELVTHLFHGKEFKLDYGNFCHDLAILDLFCVWLIVLLGRVPMYSEAKLAFYIYLWYPKTKV